MKQKKSIFKKIYTENPGENFIKKEDSWTSIIFSDPFSIPIARLAAKSKILIPNHFTVIGLIPAILAIYFFFCGELIYGAIFYLINFILDGVDGKLARLTKKVSKSGEKLDYFSDRFRNLLLYLAIWYSQFYLNDEWFVGGCFIAAHYALMVLGYLFIEKYTYKTIFPRVYSYYATLDEGFILFFSLTLINKVRIGLPILILMQSISYLVLFLTQKNKPKSKARLKQMFRL